MSKDNIRDKFIHHKVGRSGWRTDSHSSDNDNVKIISLRDIIKDKIKKWRLKYQVKQMRNKSKYSHEDHYFGPSRNKYSLSRELGKTSSYLHNENEPALVYDGHSFWVLNGIPIVSYKSLQYYTGKSDKEMSLLKLKYGEMEDPTDFYLPTARTWMTADKLSDYMI